MSSSSLHLNDLRDRSRKRRQEWVRTAGIRRRLSSRARSIIRPVLSLSRRGATRRHPGYRRYVSAGRQFQTDLQRFLANDGQYDAAELDALGTDLASLASAAVALGLEARDRRNEQARIQRLEDFAARRAESKGGARK